MKIVLIPRILDSICDQLEKDIEHYSEHKKEKPYFNHNKFFYYSEETKMKIVLSQLCHLFEHSEYFIELELDHAKRIVTMLNEKSNAYKALDSLIKEAEQTEDELFLPTNQSYFNFKLT